MLPQIAQLFGVSADELIGHKNGNGKRGPAPQLQQKIERLTRLPKAQQRLVLTTRVYDRRKMKPEDSPTFKVSY